MSVCSLVSAGNRSVVLALVSQHCVPSSDIVKQYYHQYHFILVSTIYIQSQMTQPNTDIYIHTYTRLAWLLVQGTDRYVRTHASSQPWALHVSIYISSATHIRTYMAWTDYPSTRLWLTVRPNQFLDRQTWIDQASLLQACASSLETPSWYGASQNSPPRSSHASPGNTLQFSRFTTVTVSHRRVWFACSMNHQCKNAWWWLMKLGACLRFWIVVGQVLPLHPLHPPARLRRWGELGLRVHQAAARIAAEQVAGLHREHPAASPTHTSRSSPIRILTIRIISSTLTGRHWSRVQG